MKLQIGSVVRANAGRDKEKFFVVTGKAEGYVLIADGKERKLAKPKRKNPRHISATGSMIDINDITDKKLRMLLRDYGCSE